MTTAPPQLVDATGRPLRSESRAGHAVRAFRDRFDRLQARYDASRTTDDNRRHWANADGLSASAAAAPDVRDRLRRRARYELQENNSLGKGIVLKLAKDSIGRGPRLQFTGPDEVANRMAERLVNDWLRAIRLARKLRTARVSRAVDGEIFLFQNTNERLRHPVKLDVQLVEGDQVATPDLSTDEHAIDGIRFDEDGNPVEYHKLHHHPGTDRWMGGFSLDYAKVPAEFVVHWFREDRPGQRRGIPEVTAALPLFAQRRRFVLATIAAAETAAEFAGVMYTDAPGEASDEPEAMDAIELEMRMMLTLPGGWKMAQVKAEHPATTLEMFDRVLIGEIARCVLMPYNRAAGNSSGYTFASGKLDRDDYLESIDVERHDCECEILDPLLAWFLDEATLIPGLMPEGFDTLTRRGGQLPPHVWIWDGFRETDPAKQALADDRYHALGLLTDERWLLSRGIDPDEHDRQLARQIARRERFGLPIVGTFAGGAAAASTSAPPPPDDEGEEGEEAEASGFDDLFEAAFAGDLLEAAGPTNGPHDLRAETGTIELLAAEGDGATIPTFKMEAYSGGVMQPRGFYEPVYLDLAGLTIPDQVSPSYLDHDRERIVGHTTTVTKTDKKLSAAGVLSGAGDAAREVRESAGNGFPWKSSIGASIEEREYLGERDRATVNGRTVKGPAIVVRKATLREISFVSIAGDPKTSASVAATANTTPEGNRTMFKKWLQALGLDVETLSDEQQATLRAKFDEQLEHALLAAAGEHADTLETLLASAVRGDDRGSLLERVATEARIEAAGRVTPCTPTRLAAFARALEVEATAFDAPGDEDDVEAGGNTSDEITAQRRTAAAESRRIRRVREIAARHEEIAERAIEAGWDETRTELEVLRASRPMHTPAGSGRTTQNSPAAVEAAICLSIGLPDDIACAGVDLLERTTDYDPEQRVEARRAGIDQRAANQAMGRDLRGYSLHALMDATLLQAGRSFNGSRKTDGFIRATGEALRELRASGRLEATTGFSSLSLPGILGNVANKAMIAAYEAVETVHQYFTAMRSHTDFKAWTRYRMDGQGSFQKVGADGELKHVSLSEQGYTNQIDTYGALIALTRQMIINDDLGAFAQIPGFLGRMSSIRVEEEFFKLLLSNPGSFFSTGNGNLQTGGGSALGIDGLKAARADFRNQVDSNGKPILASPDRMLVGTLLETLASDLYVETKIQPAEGKVDRNPHAGLFRPYVSPYLNNDNLTDAAGQPFTGQSDTQWYLFANPANRAAMAVATLNGQRMPTIESEDASFNVLGTVWRGYYDFGVGMEDHVAAHRNAGG